MGRNKIINLNDDKYSVLFYDFSNLFINDFPDDYDTWEILDFSVEVWNIANLKEIFPEIKFKEAASLSDGPEETSQLFEKMIDYKVKYYGDFDKFILDYSLDLEGESPKLNVVYGDLADYKGALEESEIDEDEELDENFIN